MTGNTIASPEGEGASRRAFIGGSITGAALAAASAATAQTPVPARPPGTAAAPAVLSGGANGGQVFATTETTYGRAMGQINAGIREFKGLPYGAPTGGRNRFMPPRKPAPWAGVRESLTYGPISPQTLADLRGDYAMMIMWDRHVGGMGEDPLTLNVWTPGLRGSGKRPVMVCFHGGGWETGSGNAPGFDGAQLARFADAMVVTVNHRLASFGYLNLVDNGAPPEFASAGVAGVMDMAASLEWVRDNAEAFGGDPSRVMIFGQSGGGAKTSVMLGNPGARGLFHRAAVQSGSQLKLVEREASAKSAAMLLDALGLKGRAADLQKVPWTAILEAQASLAGKASFTPTLDGRYLPHHPWDPAAPAESADVPVIVSTTLEDAALRLTNFDLDDAGLAGIFNQRFGPRADGALELYRAQGRGKRPYQLQAQAFTDVGGRAAAIHQVELKAAQGRGKVWMYQWDWECPAYDGKFGAIHGIDVSASFHSYRDQTVGSGSAAGRKMCDRLAGAWSAFAHTGDPNHAGIPHWPTYDAQTRATMLFNDDMRAVDDPRADIRRYWAANRA